jgi:hypothetical protein
MGKQWFYDDALAVHHKPLSAYDKNPMPLWVRVWGEKDRCVVVLMV